MKGLLAVRALRLSVWLCRLHDMTRAGILAPHLFVALVCFEAVTVTLLIVFSTRAQSLSRSLRYSKPDSHLPVFISVLFHLLHLLLAYFATLFSAGTLYLIVRL